MKIREQTAIEVRLENLLTRSMDFEGPMNWNLAKIAQDVYTNGGIATPIQMLDIQKHEQALEAAERKVAEEEAKAQAEAAQARAIAEAKMHTEAIEMKAHEVEPNPLSITIPELNNALIEINSLYTDPSCMQQANGAINVYLDNLFTESAAPGKFNIPLTGAQVTKIIKVLQNKNITELYMNSANLDDAALQALLSNLPSTVQKLSLDNNFFTTNGKTNLEEFIKAHPKCTINAEFSIREDSGRFTSFVHKGSAIVATSAEEDFMTAAASALPFAAAPAPAAPLRVINQKAQKALESIGQEISKQVDSLLQGLGGSDYLLKNMVKSFCDKVQKTYAEAVSHDEVTPPESLHTLMGLYNIDYHGKASEVLPELCAKLQGGLPYISDHF